MTEESFKANTIGSMTFTTKTIEEVTPKGVKIYFQCQFICKLDDRICEYFGYWYPIVKYLTAINCI